jgi:plasmid stability protein
MSKERRYEDREIRQILDLAIGQEDGPARSLPAVDGLTLLQLQDVGREVGLPPDRITQAVAAFEGRGESVPRGTTLGLPTSVGRVVPLPRSPSDREWELLIAELRTTFGGKGEMTSHGGLREWSHRNLHAFIEPTETGHRLRLEDSNGAVVGIVLGGFVLAFSLLILLVLLAKGDPDFSRLNDIGELAVPAFFSLLGGSLVAGSAMALPKWAREQERRMEHISRHAVSLLALPGSTDD